MCNLNVTIHLWVIPYQINKKILTLLDFHKIWYRHGLYKETFSHQNLADSIDLPLTLKSTCSIHVYAKQTYMASQLGLPKSISLKPDIKQKFIQWATRGRLNNQFNNNGLLGMKRWRAAVDFIFTLHSMLRPPFWLMSESRELYMICLTCNWMANQPTFI